ncbi:MAG: aspartate aminotransferase, partial [Mesorhizobium sp.]
TDSRAAGTECGSGRQADIGAVDDVEGGGEAFLRLCFHRRLDQLEEAAHRLAKWMKSV